MIKVLYYTVAMIIISFLRYLPAMLGFAVLSSATSNWNIFVGCWAVAAFFASVSEDADKLWVGLTRVENE